MKKVFLSLAIVAALTVVSCKNSENTAEAAVDSTATEAVDTAAAAVDTAAAAVEGAATEAAAPAAEATK